MLWQIFLFEVRYQLKQPLFWVSSAVFALLTFGAVSSDSITVGGSIGNVNRNAPFVIVQLMSIMSVIGIFAITAFVAGAIHRDFDRNTAELIFSKPIRKIDYMLGRFGGALVISFGVLISSGLGILIGSYMPWIDPERVGPFMFAPYLWATLVMVVPNLIFIGAVFFTVAGLTRSMLFTYLAVVGFFVAYSISGNMLGNMENESLAALFDPFGLASISNATRYWTIVEQNNSVPGITGGILLNRIIWMGAGLLVFVMGYFSFSFSKKTAGRFRRKKNTPARSADRIVESVSIPQVGRTFGRGTSLSQYWCQAKIEMASVFKSVPFIVILAFGMLNVIGSSGFANQMFGTSVWPVTHLMIQNIQGSFAFLLVIIGTFYAGELIWKERSLKLNEVYDALPISTWVPFAAKMTALVLVTFAFLIVGALTTMGYQIWNGYYTFEPLVYGKGLGIMGLPFALTCVLAVFLQVLSPNKFIGYLLVILYLISRVVMGMLDLDHSLYRFGGRMFIPYSDMNGYGHFVTPTLWIAAYWVFFAGLLAVLSVLLWRRGTDTPWKARVREMGSRFNPAMRGLAAVCLIGFLGTGAYIFYNTNVLNEYVPGDVVRERMADYEKSYRQYKDVNQPRVTAVTCNVDIYPRERRVEIRGEYTLVNKSDVPISQFHLDIPPDGEINSLEFRYHTASIEDDVLGYYVYELDEALLPGDSMPFRFDITVAANGFVNSGSNTSVVRNGTFFNNQQYFPTFGYNAGRQLTDRNRRRKLDLEPVERMAKVDDLFARRNNYLSTDSDWIDFDATVSTDLDQIAIAPGYLKEEWTEGERRYFHYEMDSPILNFYAFQSADYKVRRDRWKDVAIEIYYNEGHEYNIDRMIEAIQKSLDYYTENFSPYQHRQVRIIEFPRYATFAQSFPNTIPFSESIGFIANLEDEEDIDYVFYVTAHEVAHQWWAHQVMGGNVQGSTMLVETMAQYSALMVMEKEYGKEKMRRFLKFELDRYLRNRGGELIEEMPLLLVENQQYIHYRKGSVIMYALRDYIGEEMLNNALAEYIQQVAYQEPPWTNSLEFFEFITAATPDSLQNVLVDMFENITLFENRVGEAKFTETGEGEYVVALDIRARKVRADGKGVETEVPIDDWIDIGVFGEDDKVLYLEKHRIREKESIIEITVHEEPQEAGIDPYNKLVDRNSDDNRKKVSHDDVDLAVLTP